LFLGKALLLRGRVIGEFPEFSAAMSEAFLKIENLTKNFGQFTALRNISLEVFEGEFVCFLGPSGCGKTTLLRAIAGLDIQTQGSIAQAGEDISVLPPAERDFGIVFQSYALFPNLSVEKNVAYGLESRRAHRNEVSQRVAELLALVDLADQAKKYPAQLSGGQQQRVALARALAMSPGLLLLDEPLSALDAKVRAHLRMEIKELQRRLAVTTIMVTHDQEEALTMADRIVVMNHGVIEQIGTPQEIYASPASQFVADFIGTMNFISARTASAGKCVLEDLEIAVDTSGLEAGQPVQLAIRPEDVQLGANDALEDQSQARGTIESLEYLGAFVRATVKLGQSGARVQADLSTGDIDQFALGPQSSVAVTFPAEKIRLYSLDA